MKKVIFLFAMVFAVSMVMAQMAEPVVPGVTVPVVPAFIVNTLEKNQTGDNNTANVNQNGVNYATVDQISIVGATLGKANTTNLIQDGQQNKAIVDQNRSGGQQGSQTVANASQSGDKNYLNIIQDGYYQGGNLSKVTQIGISGQAAIGNRADVNHQMGYGNNWTIYQQGDNNDASQVSTSTVVSGTTNVINQYGESNKANQYTSGGDAMKGTINQGTSLVAVVGNIARQDQSGLKSQATITQETSDNNAYQIQLYGSYDPNGGHRAAITQTGGDGNYALQYQTETVAGAFDYSRNNSTIYQDGAENTAEVNQMDGLNLGNITQTTSYNQALLIQNGLSNSAIVLQEVGNTNIVNLTQDGGAEADILQQGANNTLMGIGVGIMATSLNGSILDLDQIGDGNTLYLQQTNGASATVMQDGAINTSEVIQN